MHLIGRLATCSIAALALVPTSALAQEVPALGALGTAVVDGQMGPGEWTVASHYDFIANTVDGTAPATLFVMNDQQNLYLAVRVEVPALLYSGVSFNFDNHDTGTFGHVGDDGLTLNSTLGFFDWNLYANGYAPLDVDVGGTSDGAAAVTNNGQFSFYEFSHPLNSGDARDFALAPGDTLGYLMFLNSGCGESTCAETYVPTSYASAMAQIHIYPWQPPAPQDTTPPHLSVTATPTKLWPANHNLIPVNVTVAASDDSGAAPVVTLVSVTSSEPDEGPGAGNTGNDIQGAALGTFDTQFLLRAERLGGGPGRVYTATYQAVDGAGNISTASVKFVVRP
jgi:hypothetical protein